MLIAALLGSKARAAALFELLQQSQRPSPGLHLGELARRTGYTKATLKKILDDLVPPGLILERRDGNRRYLSLDPSHPAYRPLAELFEVTVGIPHVLRRALEKDERIALALLHGSVATQTETGASDVDLILVGTITLREAIEVIVPVQDRLRREVNPVVLSSAEFSSRRSRGEHFITQVLSSDPVILKGALPVSTHAGAVAEQRLAQAPSGKLRRDRKPARPRRGTPQ